MPKLSIALLKARDTSSNKHDNPDYTNPYWPSPRTAVIPPDPDTRFCISHGPPASPLPWHFAQPAPPPQSSHLLYSAKHARRNSREWGAGPPRQSPMSYFLAMTLMFWKPAEMKSCSKCSPLKTRSFCRPNSARMRQN